ncbi:uncharacterized protein LOC144477016 [Augochlora pura]
MALIPVRSETVLPENFNTISNARAIEYQWQFLKEWKPKQEVWWLLHGEKFVGGLCSLNALFINSLFRNKLKLHSKGVVITNLYSIVGPMLMGAGLYGSVIANNLVLFKQSCEACYQMKGNLIIQSSAVLVPITTMSLLNIGLAASLGLRVPSLHEWREYFRFSFNVLKPATKHLTLMMMLNSIAVTSVTHQQFKSVNTVAKVLVDMEDYGAQNKVNNL